MCPLQFPVYQYNSASCIYCNDGELISYLLIIMYILHPVRSRLLHTRFADLMDDVFDFGCVSAIRKCSVSKVGVEVSADPTRAYEHRGAGFTTSKCTIYQAARTTRKSYFHEPRVAAMQTIRPEIS